MDKIQDYVRWRGDLGYDVVPFTTEDIVVLCSLTYCPWEDVLGRDYWGKTIGELNSWVYRDKLPRNAATWQKSLHKLWKSIPQYKRFADIRVADFMATTYEAEEDQIAVLTYEIGDWAVVAFRGTDTTVSDWKETLEVAHQGLMPARQVALAYLNDALNKYDKVYVCGHSKGGNLALYSSAYADRQDKIVAIYNLDGPALDKKTYDEKWNSIADRVTTIIPYGSTFGVIIGYGNNYKVVSSSSKGFNQHDTFTWHFDGPNLHYVDDMSEISKAMSKTAHELIENSDEENRRLLVDTVQKLADAAGTDDTNSLAAGIAKNAANIVKEIKNFDEKDKAALKKISKHLVAEGRKTAKIARNNRRSKRK